MAVITRDPNHPREAWISARAMLRSRAQQPSGARPKAPLARGTGACRAGITRIASIARVAGSACIASCAGVAGVAGITRIAGCPCIASRAGVTGITGVTSTTRGPGATCWTRGSGRPGPGAGAQGERRQ